MPAERCPYLCDSLKGSEGTSCVPKYKRAQRRSSSRRGTAERRWAGASVFQRIVHIDVPALMPMVILNLIMSAGNLMNIGFEKVWLLQTDLNKATSDVIAVYVYQQGIENANYSYSTAVGLFNTAINLILLIIVNKIASKASDVDFV